MPSFIKTALREGLNMRKLVEFLVIAAVTIVIWNLPATFFGIDGLTVIQQRIIAIFIFATLAWLTECIPSWATSLGIITIMCLTVSDNALKPFKTVGAPLEANGTELQCTKDLRFVSGITSADKVGVSPRDAALLLNSKDISLTLQGLKEKDRITVSYVSEGGKASLKTKNAALKGGTTQDSLKSLTASVSKDGDVTLTTDAPMKVRSIELLPALGGPGKAWNFSNIAPGDLRALKIDGGSWAEKGGAYVNRAAIRNADYGLVLAAKDVMASFADPVIMLFLGGFILAIAATKSGLDVLLARNLIRPFGRKSENVLLGFLLITGCFSMFVSNTATAAMMLTFLTPVFAALPANGKGRVALTMSIPLAANLGGMGTPIGTPPNAIALKFLNELGINISFGQWMAIMLPLVIILLLISWRVILLFFPFTKKTIDLEIKGHVARGWQMWVVSGTFILTILLWVIPKSVTGIDSNTVAMVPMGIFAVTGVITAKDLQKIDWSVIWMVAGGFALGLGMNGSGLARAAIDSIPFGSWSPILILLISGLICYFLSNFISNTATAALLVPILATVCKGVGSNLDAIGGTATILLGIAVSASAAMCLPISTPPNAIAYSTGLIKQKDMLKAGLTMGLITLVLGYALLYFIGTANILG